MDRGRSSGLVHVVVKALGLAWLASCSHTVPPPPTDPATEPPRTLDEQIGALSRPKPADEDLPARAPEELRAQIEALQGERAKLLLRFTELHPAVVQIDRKIERLQARLQAGERK